MKNKFMLKSAGREPVSCDVFKFQMKFEVIQLLYMVINLALHKKTKK